MKILTKILHIALSMLALSVANTQLSTAYAQGTTAFTFQGRLNAAGAAATGNYDMTFAVWDATVAGNLIAGPLTNTAVAVSNGLFTVTLDFGSNVFTGTNYWVEMSVCTNGAGNFVKLFPRQQLTPAPYALNAATIAQPQANILSPPGAIIAFGGANIPAGWLLCNGSNVSRATYTNLYNAIGTAWGNGDGSGTTFSLPDLRGVFLRGVNGTRNDSYTDPGDARGNLFAGGNSGNAVGSYQQDMYKAHNHNLTWGIGNFQNQATPWSVPIVNMYFNNTYPTDTQGGTETRPKNAYVNYIIKY
ncbi:MAG TPA: tail fiber protein [Verrucomicrobiae bacterium]|nr:tail fiber protein [Verrucomicrobiae bacterium]